MSSRRRPPAAAGVCALRPLPQPFREVLLHNDDDNRPSAVLFAYASARRSRSGGRQFEYQLHGVIEKMRLALAH